MRLTKRQLKRIIREEYARLNRRRPLRESAELAADVWSQNGEGTDWGQELLDALNRAQSPGHLLAMCKYNDELKDTMIDLDSDCAYKKISTSAVLGWIRQNHCPKGLQAWYSVDPNEPGAFERKWGFFDG
tara:strand:- start:604 stop:993 length:390 start_codon:yes stop_codon:yes gene_type:complete